MDLTESTPNEHRVRSEFVRSLVQNRSKGITSIGGNSTSIPKAIVQFWDNTVDLPLDVEECINSWKNLGGDNFVHLLFDLEMAREFISKKLGPRHSKALEKCYHPAMKSDYFRLCFIWAEGGFYVDADDVYTGVNVDHLFNDGRLKIQPLCYDIATGQMVEPTIFAQPGAYAPNWIFYFNNNPLMAPARHPIIERALAQATHLLECSRQSDLPEIQSTTGPGNLTKSIFDLGVSCVEINSHLQILTEWKKIAITRWELSYRNDARNWRLSNQRLS